MSIAERHAAERDAALQSVAEHRALLGELNGRAGASCSPAREGGEQGDPP
jgi:hypothetical protein